MSKLKDITGERFGRLVVVKRVENDSNGQAMWLCQCDYGSEPKVIRGCSCAMVKYRLVGVSIKNNFQILGLFSGGSISWHLRHNREGRSNG